MADAQTPGDQLQPFRHHLRGLVRSVPTGLPPLFDGSDVLRQNLSSSVEVLGGKSGSKALLHFGEILPWRCQFDAPLMASIRPFIYVACCSSEAMRASAAAIRAFSASLRNWIRSSSTRILRSCDWIC